MFFTGASICILSWDNIPTKMKVTKACETKGKLNEIIILQERKSSEPMTYCVQDHKSQLLGIEPLLHMLN